MAFLYWLLLALATTLTAWQVRRAHIGWNTCASWALLALAHGLIFKPLFVAFEYPSMELIEVVLLQKITISEYWAGSVILLAPYAVFVACMLGAGRYRDRPKNDHAGSLKTIHFDERMLAALSMVALFGFVGFFTQFPQLLESANKNSIATADIADYSSGGIWRALVELAYVVSLCALLNAGRVKLKRRNLLLFGVSAALWLTFCFLSDQRGFVIFSVVTYLLAYGRFVGQVPKRAIMLIGMTMVMAIVGKTVMRLQAESGGAQEDVAIVAANFIGQNLVENGKTISIVKAVPQVIDYQLGKTYVDAVLILVPRAIFPDKTTVNLDTIIGNKVFECDAFGACGVPPGMLAESYLNFGAFGAIVLPALFGVLIGKLDARYRRVRSRGLFDLFYLYSFVFCGMAILGSGMSSVITQVLTQGIELGLVWLIAGRHTARRRHAPSATAILSAATDSTQAS